MAATKTKKHQTFGELKAMLDEEKRLRAMFQEDRDFIASKDDELKSILAKLADPANEDAVGSALGYGFSPYDFNNAASDLGSLIVSEDVFALQYAAGEAAMMAISEVWEFNPFAQYGVMALLAQNRLCEGAWSADDYNTLSNSLRVFLTVVDNSAGGSTERRTYCELVSSEDGRSVIMDLLDDDVSIEDAIVTAFGALSI